MNRKDTVNIGLVGLGTVGTGVLKMLRENLKNLEEKAGARLRLAWVCDRSHRGPVHAGGPAPKFTRQWRNVVEDPGVDIIIELIGGYEPARTLVLSALRAGKQVVTANKALLAKYWSEVLAAAQASHTLLYFEAAVGGGIPVIQGLNEGLAANRITKIFGILNGTTNYILSRMSSEGLSFHDALRAARKAGFAEADPTLDIEGIDAAQKLAILASLASGAHVPPEAVSREGITDLDVRDVRYARDRFGLVTKLLGIAHLDRNRVSARVHPALIPAAHPFANVHREYNAIFVHGDAAGDVMFYGKGAGQMAAASAVVSDLVYLARQVANGTAGEVPYATVDPARKLTFVPFQDVQCRHYLRFITRDKPGVLAQISGVLGKHGVSIESVFQEAAVGRGVSILIVTHKVPEGNVQSALRAADKLSAILRKTVHLRIEEAK